MVFQRLDEEIKQFRKASGLFCLAGCGKCCTKPDIEATKLEFLPLAYHLYKEGLAMQMIDHIEQSEDTICALFQPLQLSATAGSCADYAYRGMICRLFGYAAYLNKHGEKEISTCGLIKTGQHEAYQKAALLVQRGEMHIPVMRNYYMQLAHIDDNLSGKPLPINQAILGALEYVLFYFQLRGKRAS